MVLSGLDLSDPDLARHPSLNQGAVFTSTNWGATASYYFASSENATPEIRPRLVITYTMPTATATPTPGQMCGCRW